MSCKLGLPEIKLDIFSKKMDPEMTDILQSSIYGA